MNLITVKSVSNFIIKALGNIIAVYLITCMFTKRKITYFQAIKYGIVISFVQMILQRNMPITNAENFGGCNVCKVSREFIKNNFTLITIAVVIVGYGYYFN
jgi:hypothetical protein